MDEKKIVYPCEIRATDDEKRQVSFIASTERVARDGDIVKASAWSVEEYLANPVVLWAHDGRSLPVGKAVAVRTITRGPNKRLEIDVEFAGLEQAHRHAEAVYRLYRDGFLNAVSVGFRPLEAARLTSEEREKLGLSEWGRMITKANLVELSAVPIPSDTGAVKKGMEEDILAVRGLLSEDEQAAWDALLAARDDGSDEQDDRRDEQDESSEHEDGTEEVSDPTTDKREDDQIAALKAEVEALKAENADLKSRLHDPEDDLDTEVEDDLVDDLDEEVERSEPNPAPGGLIDDLDDPYDITSEIENRTN